MNVKRFEDPLEKRTMRMENSWFFMGIWDASQWPFATGVIERVRFPGQTFVRMCFLPPLSLSLPPSLRSISLSFFSHSSNTRADNLYRKLEEIRFRFEFELKYFKNRNNRCDRIMSFCFIFERRKGNLQDRNPSIRYKKKFLKRDF